jgi:hypothetical protein
MGWVIWGLNPSRKKRFFSPPKRPDPRLEPTQPPLSKSRGTFPRVKQSGLILTTPPFSTEVKNEWNCTFIPPICLNGVERDNFSIIFVGKYMVPGGNDKIMPQNNRCNRRDLNPLKTNTSQKPYSFKSTMLGET